MEEKAKLGSEGMVEGLGRGIGDLCFGKLCNNEPA